MRTLGRYTRALVVACACLLLSPCTQAQSLTVADGRLELGIGIGPMIFLGDLGGNYGKGKTFLKDVNLPITKVSKGLYANIYPVEWLGLRAAINHSIVDGYDSIIRNQGNAEVFRLHRNLQFRSPLYEAYVALELYPTLFGDRAQQQDIRFRPYGIGGAGMFRFNPRGQYIAANGSRSWVDLQPLNLEGQGMAEYPDRKPYSLTQVSLLTGFGAKYYVTENFYVGMEVLHRTTFTDYIDDVSTTYIDATLFNKYLGPEQVTLARQLYYREHLLAGNGTARPGREEQRGNPRQNDAFFSMILRLGFKLNEQGFPALGRFARHAERSAARQLRCPSFRR